MSAAAARPGVLWFRRDLRLHDHPALVAAAAGGPVLPLFVLDPLLWGPSGDVRRAWLVRSLEHLDASLGGRLVVRHGDPVEVVPRVAAELEAAAVHVTADAGVYGRHRDAAVEAALAAAPGAVPFVRSSTPYAVAPGTLKNGSGSPFQVFSPFQRAWLREGWPAPAPRPRTRWVESVASEGLPPAPDLGGVELPEPGERAALRRWEAFREELLPAYAGARDRPDKPGTSALSVHLKYGEVHPRTLLAGLADVPGEGAERFRSELCWRDFYADVLWNRPDSAWHPLKPEAEVPSDTGHLADERYAAWAEGRTGFPIVDAGMRQLLREGWVHNRVRMVVASFLVKDLHLPWQRGARHFLHHLRDGDPASNNQGWQWVAGTGTDAAPYFRVFNPVTQGKEHDPQGDYVRRYVPELRGVAGKAVHEPWLLPGGVPEGYPERIVDHAAERQEALARYARLRG
ncbi:cryptochrome/photolyase family protein [Motilibacter rhizosphaerae]|uniref:cryptochrome/photolyase family protein n=1 Tax=Motilibacter rhizosphaerae TaxID=598652 RepID=UPI00102B83D2|nr:deoxyribodipyrimidine photo-lyase [Motilibacter rhizosphaerae]